MSTAVSHYKSLYRRLVRLPLDVTSLNFLKESVKFKFRSSKQVSTYSVVDRKDYDTLSKIADDILERNKYRELSTLLDYIYKDQYPLEPWKLQFLSTKYNKWKLVWPQVHLIEEFGYEKHIRLYNEVLKQMDPPNMFSLVKELNLRIPSNVEPLKPLKHLVPESDLKGLLKMMRKFYAFLNKNSNFLMKAKLMPFEVTYEPTRLGIPLSVAARERKLRSKITYMKSLCQEYRPLTEEAINHLILVATDETATGNTINPNFYRYMIRVRPWQGKLGPFEQKYLKQKQLIPNDRNIRFHYRTYIVSQFYVKKGSYALSPMINIYD